MCKAAQAGCLGVRMPAQLKFWAAVTDAVQVDGEEMNQTFVYGSLSWPHSPTLMKCFLLPIAWLAIFPSLTCLAADKQKLEEPPQAKAKLTETLPKPPSPYP